MAGNATVGCSGSDDECSQDFISGVFNQCMKSEAKHEFIGLKFGHTSEFRRFTKVSNEIARNFMISKRMKNALQTKVKLSKDFRKDSLQVAISLQYLYFLKAFM